MRLLNVLLIDGQRQFVSIDEEKLLSLLDEGDDEKFLSIIDTLEKPMQYIMMSVYKFRRKAFFESLEFAKLGYSKAKESGDKNLLLRSLSRVSESLQKVGRYEEMYRILSENRDFIEGISEDNDPYVKTWISHYYYQLAMYYSLFEGDFEKSCKIFHKSLELRIQLDNKKLISSSYNAIAICKERLAKLDEALKYYTLSLNLKDENSSSYAITLSNIGGLYSNMGKLDLAKKNYLIAKSIYEMHGDYDRLIPLEELLGFVAKEKNDLSTAMIHFNNAYNFAKELKLELEEVHTLKKLVTINIAMKKYTEAERLYNKMREIVSRNSFTQFKYDLEFLSAMILREKPRISHKIKALEIFKAIAGNQRNYETIFSSMLNIMELLILEYQQYANDEDKVYVLQEIRDALKVFGEEVNRINSPSFNISFLRIKGIIEYLQGRDDEAIDLLEKALNEAEKLGLEAKIQRISQILNEVNSASFKDVKSEILAIHDEYKTLVLGNDISEKDADDFYELLSFRHQQEG